MPLRKLIDAADHIIRQRLTDFDALFKMQAFDFKPTFLTMCLGIQSSYQHAAS